MNVNLESVADIFEGLAKLAPALGAPQYAVLLHYAAVLVNLGDEALTRRKLLLDRINTWVKENRGPNVAELDAMSAQRLAGDDELAFIQSQLKGVPS